MPCRSTRPPHTPARCSPATFAGRAWSVRGSSSLPGRRPAGRRQRRRSGRRRALASASTTGGRGLPRPRSACRSRAAGADRTSTAAAVLRARRGSTAAVRPPSEGHAPQREPALELGLDRQLAADLDLQLELPLGASLLVAGGGHERVPAAALEVVDEVDRAAVCALEGEPVSYTHLTLPTIYSV